MFIHKTQVIKFVTKNTVAQPWTKNKTYNYATFV